MGKFLELDGRTGGREVEVCGGRKHFQRVNLWKHLRLLIIAWYEDRHGRRLSHQFIRVWRRKFLSRLALITKLFFHKLKHTTVSRLPQSFGVTFRTFNMENIKQLMANVDAYMTRLIEAVEMIESGDFPHSEGQFFIFFCSVPRYCVCSKSGRIGWMKIPAKVVSGINKQSERRSKNIFMNFGAVCINTQQKILANYC